MVPAGLRAQTSYPMVMSIHPVAARVGESSEHEISSRYSMFGAYRVLVTGDGVTGEVVTPMEKKDGKEPNLTKIKVRFTVAADAQPGVRDVRLATPHGASTLGQLVIVRDPVVTEEGNNNAPDQAQEISVPSTVCGRIERNEDVDNFRFRVDAGTVLNFHVRSMRLENKIHDLQQHADPIISVRSASGSTLAQSDNSFAGDPFLSYRFERAGEYLLEIRDVRYQGNGYWEYSIEISDRPFVRNVFPLGVAAGGETTFQLIGSHLPERATASLTVPADLPMGPQWLQLPLPPSPHLAARDAPGAKAAGDKGAGLSNPVPVVVSDLPLVTETDADNDAPEHGQSITVPAGVNGRIEKEADVDCFRFDAKKGEAFTFEVVGRRQQSSLDSVIRILNAAGKQLADNDDMRVFKYTYFDSQIENWTVPADGTYVVEIRDVHLRGGPTFVYFLKITRPEPRFELYLDTDKTQLTPGTDGVMFARVERKNGFQGDVQLAIDGLPDGVTATCGRILADGQDGCLILQAGPQASLSAANVTVTGTATLQAPAGEDSKGSAAEPITLTAVAQPLQETYMPGGGRSHWPVELHTVAVGAPSDIRAVKISPAEVALKPGESQRIEIEVDRSPEYDKNVTLDMLFRHLSSTFANTLPKGVSIDGGKSKTLLTGKETKGYITLKAAPDAPPCDKQQVSVMANISLNFVMKATYSSQPLFVSVVKP